MSDELVRDDGDGNRTQTCPHCDGPVTWRDDEVERLTRRLALPQSAFEAATMKAASDTERELRAEVERLRKDARRWFTADGEVDMEPEQVVEKRKQAAKELALLTKEGKSDED